jgi:hypothetical protein
MRLRIVLPKVKPEVIAVPTRCVYAGCGGRKFHLRQHVIKPVRDTVYQQAQVPRERRPAQRQKMQMRTIVCWRYTHERRGPPANHQHLPQTTALRQKTG